MKVLCICWLKFWIMNNVKVIKLIGKPGKQHNNNNNNTTLTGAIAAWDEPPQHFGYISVYRKRELTPPKY